MNLVHTVRLCAGIGTLGVLGWCCWSTVRWAVTVPGRLAAWYRHATADPLVTAVLEAEPEVPTEAAPELEAEHQGVDERGMAGYVAPVLLYLGETPAGPLLCDRPLCPPPGSDAWWAVRFGRGRQLDTLRLATVGRTSLPDWFAALVAREEHLLAAQTALFHHLTETVFERTAEHQLVGARR